MYYNARPWEPFIPTPHPNTTMARSHTSPHQVAFSVPVLVKIAYQFEDVTHFCKLAVVSKAFHSASIWGMYRHLLIPDASTNGDRQVATLRRRLLIRTLEENPSLGKATMSVSTGLTPLNDVTRLLQACPQMQHLRWQVVNVPLEPLNTDWYLSSKLPSLSATLTSFALHQQVSSPYWPESLDKAIKDADNIRNISLYTPPGPAKVVLSALGSQLSSLSIWVWGQDHGHMPTGELQSLLAAVPKLASLRLYTIRPHQLEELHFLSELRKLSFDQVLHGVVDEVMRLIATNPSWCPNLSRFPHFNRVSDASYYFTKKGRAKWQTLKNKSRLVKMYAARDRPAWRVDGSEIDHLMNRLTRNGDGEGETPVPWSQLGPQHTRWYGAKKPKSPSC